jgi:murein DD-endopeptidase MepM/ murein hydrolase activator NlpD
MTSTQPKVRHRPCGGGTAPGALIGLVALSGCATARELPSWDDDAQEGVRVQAREVPPPPVPGALVATVNLDAVAVQPESSRQASLLETADRLELALVRFREERRLVAGQNASGTAWPTAMQALWENLLGQLEHGFQRDDAGDMSRRLFLRARVTTEVERDLTERRFGPCPEDLGDRIGRLHQLIATRMRANARDRDEDGAAFGRASDLIHWPVTPIQVTSFFGLRKDPVDGEDRVKFHSGIDLGGSRGDLVYAAASGRVLHAGWWGGYGRAVIVQHANGFETVYGHLQRVLVIEGTRLDAGSPIGQIGSSGRSTGPHLHFEVRQWGVALNPMEAVGATFERLGKRSVKGAVGAPGSAGQLGAPAQAMMGARD